MKKKRFSYAAFVADIAFRCLESDLACGMEVFDECPNREAAGRAMNRLIKRLRKKGQGVPAEKEWPRFPSMAEKS